MLLLLLLSKLAASASIVRGSTSSTAHKLSKRAWTFDCPPDVQLPKAWGPPGTPQDAHIAQFTSPTQLCSNYPDGLGIYCDQTPQMLLTQPVSGLVYSHLTIYYQQFCTQHCGCADIAPNDPVDVPPARAQCSDSESEDEAHQPQGNQPHGTQAQCAADAATGQPDDPAHDSFNPIICNADYFGHPSDYDCEPANKPLFDKAYDAPDREHLFVTRGTTSVHEDTYEPNYVPLSYQHGSCNVTVNLLEGLGHHTEDFSDWEGLAYGIRRVRNKCVVPGLGGGWTYVGDNNDIGLFIYGPTSSFGRLLALKYDCRVDLTGNLICNPPPTTTTTPSTSSPDNDPAKAQSQSNPQDQSNRLHGGRAGHACLGHTDCDYHHNYLCASSAGIPLSSTWGTFKCTFVANAAALLGTLSIASCRGRCIMEADGSFEYLNSTASVSALPPLNTLSYIAGNDSVHRVAEPLVLNTTEDAAMDPARFGAAEGLVCPCNCTYVSPTCCLSGTGIVWEGSGMRVQTTVGAPNETVCCDGETGQWVGAGMGVDLGDPGCPVKGELGSGVVNT